MISTKRQFYSILFLEIPYKNVTRKKRFLIKKKGFNCFLHKNITELNLYNFSQVLPHPYRQHIAFQFLNTVIPKFHKLKMSPCTSIPIKEHFIT